MEKELRVARAGTLLSIESGEYSDRQTHGFFVVLKDFKPFNMRDEYVAEKNTGKSTEDYGGINDYEFLPWLLAKGVVLEIGYSTIHIESYSRICEFDYYEATHD